MNSSENMDRDSDHFLMVTDEHYLVETEKTDPDISVPRKLRAAKERLNVPVLNGVDALQMELSLVVAPMSSGCPGDRFQLFRSQGLDFEGISKRLRVSTCYDANELLDRLNGLQHVLHNQFTLNAAVDLKLIVIDSIGALFASVIGSGSTAQTLLQTTAHMLRVLSNGYGIPIITINHAVQSRTEETPGTVSAKSHKPALGNSWASVPTQTLFFTDVPPRTGKTSEVWEFQNRNGETISMIRRRVEVLKSRNVPLGTWRYLYIGSKDMISFPE
ncbi:hypothetical protein HDU78_004714 [Chytriomyces hyalinus]|nr:hypothetical protein HDU78_004714 [Chytriomyces hyalinus]